LVTIEWLQGEGELAQCWKELLAVRKCLEHEKECLRGKFVLIRADATTTLRYINKGKGDSVVLTALMREIWDICIKWEIAVVAEHLSGERMIATGVDSMSRVTEFTVSSKIFQWLNRTVGFGKVQGFGSYTLDLYASKKTAKCKRFCSKA
jgi:hypothetical protein